MRAAEAWMQKFAREPLVANMGRNELRPYKNRMS
jgi:hypothetical protein